MSADGRWSELLAEAQSRLDELNSGAGGGSLGEAITLGENEHWRGRWRGEGALQTREGPRSVYLVWNVDGSSGFFFQHARLVQEIDEVRPAIGDDVLILRGDDVTWETRDGEKRTVFAYSVVARRCDDPLPGAGMRAPVGSSSGSAESFDNDIPFTPTV